MELIDTLSGQVLVWIFVAINLLAFVVMGSDKRKAVRGNNSDRSPEGFLFFLAAMFGSFGVFLGMYTFRHKTRHWYFQVGIPMMMVQNLATVYAVWTLIQ